MVVDTQYGYVVIIIVIDNGCNVKAAYGAVMR